MAKWSGYVQFIDNSQLVLLELNHILLGEVPTLVTASYSGTTYEMCVYWETATFNSNVTWDWWRQKSVAMCSDKLDQRLLRWRDRMRSGDGRRCSAFVSVCLSQDGRNNHMFSLPQYESQQSYVVSVSVFLSQGSLCTLNVVYAWMFEP